MTVSIKSQLAAEVQRNAGAWALVNHLWLPSSGGPFTWDRHEYLQEPYEIQAPLLVFEKGAQLGFSERAVIRSFHDCKFRLKSGLIYYFPTKTDVTDFSKARFGPLIEENKFLKDLVMDTDTVNIKRVGKVMLYLRGLQSSVSAKSAAADKLVYDEIDEAPDDKVDLALKRLDHSDIGDLEFLSTPTMTDYGVDYWFQKTDQRYRHIFCEHCRTYTCLEKTFPDCLVEQKNGITIRACIKCGKELDLGHPKNEYVADFPGREWHNKPAVGYRISQLQSTYVPPSQILEEFREGRFLQDFYNSRLAQPYIDASNRLDVGHVLALCGTHGFEYNSRESTAIGVDIGPEKHHVVIGRKETGGSARIIYLGEHDWDGLNNLVDRYNGTLVMDGLPEPKRARDFSKAHPYKAYACFYTQSAFHSQRWDNEDSKVVVYQTEAMDSSHAMLQQGKVILPKMSDLVKEFAQHCHNVARKKIVDEQTGSIRHTWIKTGPDHFRKAFNYMCLALEKARETSYFGRDYAGLANAGFYKTYS
jgi:hypothetical protein